MNTKVKYIASGIYVAVSTTIIFTAINCYNGSTIIESIDDEIPVVGMANYISELTECDVSDEEFYSTLDIEATTLVASSENVEESEYASTYMVITDEDSYVNIRESADIDSEIVGKAYAYSGGTVIEQGSEWTYVSSGNATGYINNDYLIFGEDVEEEATEQGLWVATVDGESVRVREKASTDSDILGLATNGESYTVKSQEKDGWVKIEYDGETGYISADYVDVSIDLDTAVTIEEEEAAEEAAAEEAAAEEAAAEEAAAEEAAAEEAAAAEAESEEAEFEDAIQSAIDDGTTAEILSESIYSVSDRDAYMLACLVQAEAGSEVYAGKLAVANVVITRYLSGIYGSTIEDVIYTASAFSVVSSGYFDNAIINGPNSTSIKAAEEALAGTDNNYYTNFCSGSYYNSTGVSYSSGEFIGSQFFYK